MKYLVTGATGNIGSLVTQRLLDAGETPCVLVRDAKKARKLFGDRVEIRVGDLASSRNDLKSAFQGCDALFLVNTGPDLGERDHTCALAARDAGVHHLGKLSTLDVKTGVGTGPWHARGEEAIRESGVRHTFIQTSAFMSNAMSWAESIRMDGVLSSSTGEGKIAFIHPDDIADVVVSVLSQGETANDVLVITGAKALSYREMATAIGEAIGKSVRYEALSDAEAMAGALTWADRAYAEALVDIWRTVREGRLATVSDGVQQLLGRTPKSFGDWISENVRYFSKRAGRPR
ncbi:NAD(P)H-binding protein [Dyella choica]|uniref:NAD-dependent epimerase/dehydratase family protein n=1 Tax=Dyella choica TaxID=1927959 RepID=A0A3S0RWM7_9GAMM|nr:NAD(P)H-binding protein [Dyella choica]RUL68681.1 NAD-dependent epimerase/dehydratase family protein [Dyella choica]